MIGLLQVIYILEVLYNKISLLVVTPLSDKQVLEEDMMILSVIEAYCFSTRSRQTVNCKCFYVFSIVICNL